MALSRGAKWVIGVLAAMALIVGGGVAAVTWALGGSPGEGEPVTVVVEEGVTASVVANELDARGVIRSSLAFRLRARSINLDRALAAGTYELRTGMSVSEALAALQAGPQAPEAIRFTVPEGYTVEDTLAVLARQTPFTAAELRAVLDAGDLELPEWVPPLDSFGEGVREPYEGLLFPETYEVGLQSSAARILQRMADQLDSVYDGIDDDEIAAAADRGFDRYQALVIASLIEEEAKVAEERATIAGVIYNRLARGMPLQIDAANIYAVGEHTEDVGGRYLEIDSPYNLYRNEGLPPTPISAPGGASIRAAFAPEEHDYLYYVLVDEEGRHAFAETLEEHNRNREQYDELRERRRRATTSPGAGDAGAPPGAPAAETGP